MQFKVYPGVRREYNERGTVIVAKRILDLDTSDGRKGPPKNPITCCKTLHPSATRLGPLPGMIRGDACCSKIFRVLRGLGGSTIHERSPRAADGRPAIRASANIKPKPRKGAKRHEGGGTHGPSLLATTSGVLLSFLRLFVAILSLCGAAHAALLGLALHTRIRVIRGS